MENKQLVDESVYAAVPLTSVTVLNITNDDFKTIYRGY